MERTPTESEQNHWLWADDGVFVVEGPPIEEGCFGEGFDSVYDWLFGQTCPAVIAGESVPEPLAHGDGRVTLNTRVDADGVAHTRGRVVATLTTADGRYVHLNTHGEEGALQDLVSHGG